MGVGRDGRVIDLHVLTGREGGRRTGVEHSSRVESEGTHGSCPLAPQRSDVCRLSLPGPEVATARVPFTKNETADPGGPYPGIDRAPPAPRRWAWRPPAPASPREGLPSVNRLSVRRLHTQLYSDTADAYTLYVRECGVDRPTPGGSQCPKTLATDHLLGKEKWPTRVGDYVKKRGAGSEVG